MKNIILRNAIFLALALVVATQAKASAPTSWIDVVGTYGADPTCTADSGPAINNAIAAAKAPGSVLFFQTGCYLINTEILDVNKVSGITYLGDGSVTLQAGASANLPAILQIGLDGYPISGRRIVNLVFNCTASASATSAYAADGIDFDNFSNSVFEDVQILNCGSCGLRGNSNSGSMGITFRGGVIQSRFGASNGVLLNYGSENWTFVGTTVMGPRSGSDLNVTGVGINILASPILGSGFVCVNCNVSNWNIGIAAGLGRPVHGVEISGGIYAGNREAAIRIGGPGDPSYQAYGVSIHGAVFNSRTADVGTASDTAYCVDLEQATGFSIVGNTFYCLNKAVRALAANSAFSLTGANNGVVGPNEDTVNVANGGVYVLQGRDITFFGPACSTSASPANCGFASSGTVAIPAGAFTLTVNDPFVTATSRIAVSENMTLGPQLGITCNTVGGRTYSITNTVPGTSFAITAASAPAGNPACLTFHIEN